MSFTQGAPQILFWLIRIEIQILSASAWLQHATSVRFLHPPYPWSKGNITCLVTYYIYFFTVQCPRLVFVNEMGISLLDLKFQEGRDCVLNKFSGV